MSGNQKLVDLRSDTVTRPTPAMRKAMAEAEVGDDVYGEDPTLNRLQEKAAELLGREAALYVPTGSMGNLIAMRVHGDHGGEVVCDVRGHIFNFENASVAAVAGLLARPVTTSDGHPRWEQIESVLTPKVYYRAPQRVIALENTQNLAGGRVMPEGVQAEICAEAGKRGLKVHLDGARIFNAAVASGRSVAELAAGVDSVMFCLSKGLGAPVGSLLVGTVEFISEARVYRKMFGGAMRQAGVLAAAGLVALDQNVERLAVDHERAKTLAAGLAELPGVEIDPTVVETNILVFDIGGTGQTADGLASRLADVGVLAGAMDDRTMRMVTHYDVPDDGVQTALAAMAGILKAAS